MSFCLDVMANSNLTTQRIHYGNKITYLSIVGGRDWRTKHGNLSRINHCRTQHVWSVPKTTNDLMVDLAIYLFCRKNTKNRFEIHTSVLVEIFNLMKEIASYNKKLTILIDSNIQLADDNTTANNNNNNSTIDAILFMGKYLDIIRGLEFATSSLVGNNNIKNTMMMMQSQIINKITAISTSLEYLGLEIVLPSKKKDDNNHDDDNRHTWILSNVLTNNKKSIQNLYLNISDDDDNGSYDEEATSSQNKDSLTEIGNYLKSNTCIKNLSVTFSKSENLFWIFDALVRNDDDNNNDGVCGHHDHYSSIETLTLIYKNEVQLHHAMVDYIVPILVSPNCPIIELELGAVTSNIVIQNPSFLIELLLPALKQNKSLKRLTLQRNKLTEKDVDGLLCCLYDSDNSSLTSLDLEYNHIRSFEFVDFFRLIDQQQRNDFTAFKLFIEELNVQNNPIQWNIRRNVRDYNSQCKLLRICPHLYLFGWNFETFWVDYARMQMLKKQQGPPACTPFVLQTMADTNRCRREVFLEVDNAINPMLLPKIVHRIKRRLNIDCNIRRQANIIYQLLQRNPAILDFKESM